MRKQPSWKLKVWGTLTVLAGIAWCVVTIYDAWTGYWDIVPTVESSSPVLKGIITFFSVLGLLTFDIQQARFANGWNRLGSILTTVGSARMMSDHNWPGFYYPTYVIGLLLIGIIYFRTMQDDWRRGFPAIIGILAIFAAGMAYLVMPTEVRTYWSVIFNLISTFLTLSLGICWMVLGCLIWKHELEEQLSAV